MRNAGRILIILLSVLLGLIGAAVAAVYLGSDTRLNTIYQITVDLPTIPTDATSIERGSHLAVAVTGCADCHASRLEGKVFVDAPPFRAVAANLTRGAGGVGGTYSDADWVRAIRHGVNPAGKPLLLMPSQHFAALSDDDLAALIAYLKSVPPVDNQLLPTEMRTLGRVLLLAGQLPPFPAEVIDHTSARREAPPPAATVEYGRYLTTIGACAECHGQQLAGSPPVEEGAPPGPNLTPGGQLADWVEADFRRAMREGITPNGHRLNAAMPWRVYSQMSDEELEAIYRYLMSLPPLDAQTAAR